MNYHHYITYYPSPITYELYDEDPKMHLSTPSSSSLTSTQIIPLHIIPKPSTTQANLYINLLSQCNSLSTTLGTQYTPDLLHFFLIKTQFNIENLIKLLTTSSFSALSKEYYFNTWISTPRFSPAKFNEYYENYLNNCMLFGQHPNQPSTLLELNESNSQHASKSDGDSEYMCDICCDTFPLYSPASKSIFQQQLLFFAQTESPTTSSTSQSHYSHILSHNSNDNEKQGNDQQSQQLTPKQLQQHICQYAYAPCQHQCCLTCWYQHILTNIAQGKLIIPCIYDTCKAWLPRAFIQYIIYFVTKFHLLTPSTTIPLSSPLQHQNVSIKSTDSQIQSQILPMKPFSFLNNSLINFSQLLETPLAPSSLSILPSTNDFSASPIPLSTYTIQEFSELDTNYSKQATNSNNILITAYDALFFNHYIHINSTTLQRCTHPCQLVHDFSTCNTSISQCTGCTKRMCIDCNSPHHFPLTCLMVNVWNEYLTTNKGNQLWLMNNSRRCPSCNVSIEKNSGCNHITCLCGYEFCWTCNGNWKTHIELNKDRPMNAYKCTSQQSTLQNNLNLNTVAIHSTMKKKDENDEPSTPSLNSVGNSGVTNTNTINNMFSSSLSSLNSVPLSSSIKEPTKDINVLGLQWNIFNYEWLAKKHATTANSFIPSLFDTSHLFYLSSTLQLPNLDIFFMKVHLKLAEIYSTLKFYSILSFFVHKPTEFITYLKSAVKSRQTLRLSKVQEYQELIKSMQNQSQSHFNNQLINDNNNQYHTTIDMNILDPTNSSSTNNNNNNISPNSNHSTTPHSIDSLTHLIERLKNEQNSDKTQYQRFIPLFTELSRMEDSVTKSQEHLQHLIAHESDDENDNNVSNNSRSGGSANDFSPSSTTLILGANDSHTSIIIDNSRNNNNISGNSITAAKQRYKEQVQLFFDEKKKIISPLYSFRVDEMKELIPIIEALLEKYTQLVGNSHFTIYLQSINNKTFLPQINTILHELYLCLNHAEKHINIALYYIPEVLR